MARGCSASPGTSFLDAVLLLATGCHQALPHGAPGIRPLLCSEPQEHEAWWTHRMSVARGWTRGPSGA